MGTIAQHATPGDYPISCDICGIEWMRSVMRPIGDGKLACPDDFPGVHEKEARALDARARPFPPPVRSRKKVRFASVTPSYQYEEARIFNFLTSTNRGGLPPYVFWNITGGDGATAGPVSVASAGWAGVYLYSVIEENLRPGIWITRAKTKLVGLADWLCRHQFGNAEANENFAAAPTKTWWGGFQAEIGLDAGGFLNPAAVTSYELGLGGLALLRAYQATGDGRYQRAAMMAATCLRRMQCGDKLTVTYSTATASGARHHHGMWTRYFLMVDNAGGGEAPAEPDHPFVPGLAKYTDILQFDHTYFPTLLPGLEFLQALRSIVGDGTYGDTSAVGDFAQRTDATVSTMIDEAKAFWVDGAKNEGASTNTVGWSSSTPFESFQSATSDGRVAAWQLTGSNEFSGYGWAIGLYAWHKLYGYDAKISDIWPWLQTATSTNEIQGSPSPSDLAGNLEGPWNPKLALGTFYTVVGGVPNETASTYEWATAGLLAGIQSVQDNAGFTLAKNTLSPKRHRFNENTPRDAYFDDLLLIGESGLSFQTQNVSFGGDGSVVQSAILAAQVGLMYRFAPKSFGIAGGI